MIYLAILFGILFGDLTLKKYVEQKLPPGSEDGVTDGPVRIRLLHNSGIAGGGFPEHTKKITAVTAAVLAGFALQAAGLRRTRGKAAQKTGLALLLGGGMSNWYERFAKGYVTDYLSLNAGPEKLRRLVFNLSDLCIMTGALLLVLSPSERERRKKNEKSC